MLNTTRFALVLFFFMAICYPVSTQAKQEKVSAKGANESVMLFRLVVHPSLVVNLESRKRAKCVDGFFPESCWRTITHTEFSTHRKRYGRTSYHRFYYLEEQFHSFTLRNRSGQVLVGRFKRPLDKERYIEATKLYTALSENGNYYLGTITVGPDFKLTVTDTFETDQEEFAQKFPDIDMASVQPKLLKIAHLDVTNRELMRMGRSLLEQTSPAG